MKFRADPVEFDVVVTDYSMPGMNGLELARTLHAVRPDIPILLCTGYLDDLPEDVLREAGVRLTPEAGGPGPHGRRDRLPARP